MVDGRSGVDVGAAALGVAGGSVWWLGLAGLGFLALLVTVVHCPLPVAVFPYSLSVNPSQGFPHGTVDELQSYPSATHLHVVTSSSMRGVEAGGSPFPCKCGSPDKTDAGS